MEYKNSAKREKGKHPKEVSANYESESNLLTIPNFVKRQLETHFSSLQKEVTCMKQEEKKIWRMGRHGKKTSKLKGWN